MPVCTWRLQSKQQLAAWEELKMTSQDSGAYIGSKTVKRECFCIGSESSRLYYCGRGLSWGHRTCTCDLVDVTPKGKYSSWGLNLTPSTKLFFLFISQRLENSGLFLLSACKPYQYSLAVVRTGGCMVDWATRAADRWTWWSPELLSLAAANKSDLLRL